MRLPPEKHQRRGDAAGAMMREIVCRIAKRRSRRLRHWRSYGTNPLPTLAKARDEPFSAFPSWFLRIECDRCGKVSMLNEAHTTGRRRDMPLRALLARMRHDGCGGFPGQAIRQAGPMARR